MNVALMVPGATPGHRVEIALASEVDVLQERSVPIETAGTATVVERLSLGGFTGGDYRVTARLLNEDGVAVAETSTPLRVSPRSELFRPGFFSRRAFDASVPGAIDLAHGSQWLNAGAILEARGALERSVGANPNLDPARWGLAWIDIRMGAPARALELLTPLAASHPHRYEVVAGIGMASYLLRDFDASIDNLERALDIRPPDTLVLNALGDSYARRGRSDEARATFERSLELRPGQAQIEERLSVLAGR